MKYSVLVGLLIVLSSAGIGASQKEKLVDEDQKQLAIFKQGWQWLIKRVQATSNKQLRFDGEAASWELEEANVVEVRSSGGVVTVSIDTGDTGLSRAELIHEKEKQFAATKKTFELIRRKHQRTLEKMNKEHEKAMSDRDAIIEALRDDINKDEHKGQEDAIVHTTTESTNNFWRGAWQGAGLATVATLGIVWSVHAWNNR